MIASTNGDEGGRRPIKRALVSVYDKTDLLVVAGALIDAGAEIVSTGSTAETIAEAGLPVTPIEKVTGFPECLDGRVKTLHPTIHGGLLDLRSAPGQGNPRRSVHRRKTPYPPNNSPPMRA